MTRSKKSDADLIRTVLRVLLPLLILAGGLWGARTLGQSRKAPVTKAPQVFAPLVECVTLEPQRARLDVRANGTVTPRTSTVILGEVAARVTRISPRLEVGAFFAEGEVLIELERRDLELALVQAEGQVADAKLALALEEAEAQAATEEWQANSDKPAPDLVQRIPQLASARAKVSSAEAAVDAARLDLERTQVRAPYAGRVRSKQVDIGQFVTRGTQLATVYAIDAVEVRLPLHDGDLEFLDLQMAANATPSQGTTPSQPGPLVQLRAAFAGAEHEWNGYIDRTEGEIGERSRMVYAVARIEDPYAPTANQQRVPLLLGMFVEATIHGREVDDIFLLPRDTIRGENQVLVVDVDRKIRIREVELLRTDSELAYVSGGVASGDLLCTTRLEVYAEGMTVRVVGDEPAKPLPQSPATKEAAGGAGDGSSGSAGDAESESDQENYLPEETDR